MFDDNKTQGQYESSKETREDANANWDVIFRTIRRYLSSILNLRKGVDREATIEGIKVDVEFKGHAAWILVCSIVIACVGLGENNIPVIVGAMLISPLMGPILGIGLGAGINDFELLKKSLVNFGTAIGISLVISTLYFLIVPVPEITEELISRRNATTLAIVIAFFGGLAGIIAGSRIFKNNVVPGVAIATALMPPLCTAGFGLATANWDYFLGALYLFFINSVFIAIPTYLYIKYMKFPLVEFVDPRKEAKIRRRILIFLAIIIIPSGFFFYNILSDSVFNRNAKSYISYVDSELKRTNTRMIYSEILNEGEGKQIKIGLMGDHVDSTEIKRWEDELFKHDVKFCSLEVIQDEDYSQRWDEFQEKSMIENRLFVENMVHTNELKIEELKKEIEDYKSRHIDLRGVEEEMRILFPEISTISYAELVKFQGGTSPDTVPTFFLEWTNLDSEDVLRAEEWLYQKYEGKDISVIVGDSIP